MSLENLDAIIARLRIVYSGDPILAEDHNDLVDAVKEIRNILEQLQQQVGAPTAPENPSGLQPHDALCELCDGGLDIACDWVAFYPISPTFDNALETRFIGTDFPSSAFSDYGDRHYIHMFPHNTEYSATYVSSEYLDKMLSWLASKYGYPFSEYLERLAFFRAYGDEYKLGLYLALKARENSLTSSQAPILRLMYNANDNIELRMKPDGNLVLVKAFYTNVGLPSTSPSVIEDINYNVVNNWLIVLTDRELKTLILISKDLTVVKTYDIPSILGYTPNYLEAEPCIGYVNNAGEKATFTYDWIWAYVRGYRIA